MTVGLALLKVCGDGGVAHSHQAAGRGDRCTGSQTIAQPLQNTDRVERYDLGAAAADGDCRISVRPDHGDGLDLVLVERQYVAIIFQQYDAFARGLQRDLAAFLVEARDGRVLLLAAGPAKFKLNTKNSADFIVDGVFGDLSGFD